jgi:cytoskeletal protein CcmA (bactofilin family)
MKIYKTQASVEADIKNGVLAIIGDVKFECDISIFANIVITAGDITVWNITARNITARNITAWNITAGDINAGDINAGDINARDINAWDINAWDINARDIKYYAFCCVYNNIKCKSITSKKEKHHKPICLDGKLEIIKDDEVEKAIKLLIDKGKLKDGKILI